MTTKEQQTVDSLLKAIQDLRTENAKFREYERYMSELMVA